MGTLICPATALITIYDGKIAEIYAEADAKIMKELGCDAVMCALRDVNRMRLEAFEKVIAEARAEPPSNRDALN